MYTSFTQTPLSIKVIIVGFEFSVSKDRMLWSMFIHRNINNRRREKIPVLILPQLSLD